MQSELSKRIITTIIYYDILDYPLTSFEIWKYLISKKRKEENEKREDQSPCSLSKVVIALDDNDTRRYIEEYRGFYFPKGRRELVAKRLERSKIAEKKYKILERAVFWLRFVPFVRMILVTGRLAMKNTEKKSDLDLLIALKGGHIFTGRFLATGLVHILGMRRYGRKIANRVCLNYFITDQSLEIADQNIFSSSEYYFARPLFGKEVFKKFQAVNDWIETIRANYVIEESFNLKLVEEGVFTRKIRETGEKIYSFPFWEKYFEKWQKNRVARDSRTYLSGSLVSVNKDALVFLPEPQWPRIKELFLKKLQAILGE